MLKKSGKFPRKPEDLRSFINISDRLKYLPVISIFMKVHYFEKKEEVSFGFDANCGGTLVSRVYYVPSLGLVFGKRSVEWADKPNFFVEENARFIKEAEDVIDGKCAPNDGASYSKVKEFEFDQEKIVKMIDEIKQYNQSSSRISSELEGMLKG